MESLSVIQRKVIASQDHSASRPVLLRTSLLYGSRQIGYPDPFQLVGEACP